MRYRRQVFSLDTGKRDGNLAVGYKLHDDTAQFSSQIALRRA
jgi:hypothetical protein